MADDKVVRLDFGSKKPVSTPTPASPATPESLRNFVRAAAGATWAGKFRVEAPDGKQSELDAEVAGFATVLGTFDVQRVLNKLVQRHEGKIREYKSLVEGYTDEDLRAWLAAPKDSDLQRKPYFFHALIDEAKKRFLFGLKHDTVQAPESEVSDDYKQIGPLTGDMLARAQKDLVYMLVNQAFVHAMRNKLVKAGDTIFNLTGYEPDQESIRLRRQGLRSYSLEDICNEVEKTHQLQWRKQPSYLGALTLEHHYRVQAALSLMNEEEADPGSAG